MADLLSSVLSAGEWLKTWDHVLTRGPRFFYAFMLAYLIHCRRVAARSASAPPPARRELSAAAASRCAPPAAATSV
jgi:hypothetical protein